MQESIIINFNLFSPIHLCWIQEVTQEKHGLRLRLEALEEEYESTARELQSDISGLRKELDEEREQTQTSDKNRSQVIAELTQQNERLTEQVRKVYMSYIIMPGTSCTWVFKMIDNSVNTMNSPDYNI